MSFAPNPATAFLRSIGCRFNIYSEKNKSSRRIKWYGAKIGGEAQQRGFLAAAQLAYGAAFIKVQFVDVLRQDRGLRYRGVPFVSVTIARRPG